MNEKYYYIVVDTLEKTLEIFPAASCQATTEKAIAAAKFGIDNFSSMQENTLLSNNPAPACG